MTKDENQTGTYALPGSTIEDLKNMLKMVTGFKMGHITADRFRAFRVPMGVYEQRKEGTYMVRVCIAAGCVLL